MEHLSSDMEHQEVLQIQWRRDKIQELCSKGYSQREISQTLQVGLATVNRDIAYLRNQAKTNIRKYIDERLPEEYEKCLVGLTAILREAWNTTLSEDKDLLEEEQEEKAGEITTAITNQVLKYTIPYIIGPKAVTNIALVNFACFAFRILADIHTGMETTAHRIKNEAIAIAMNKIEDSFIVGI